MLLPDYPAAKGKPKAAALEPILDGESERQCVIEEGGIMFWGHGDTNGSIIRRWGMSSDDETTN